MQEARDSIRAAILLSVAFLLIFTSYGGIESLQTSIIPGECKGCLEGPANGICQAGSVCQDKVKFTCDDACAAPFTECQSTLGSTILGLVYLAFTLTAFVGPVIPNYLGMKVSMFTGSLFYALFAFANLTVALTPNQTSLHSGVMLPASVILGISASVLWIAQASYVTRLSVIYADLKNEPTVSSMGTFNGIFFAIFNMSGISGNLISSLVLGYFGWSKTSLFIIYSALGLSGSCLLLFLPKLSDTTDHQPTIVDTVEKDVAAFDAIATPSVDKDCAVTTDDKFSLRSLWRVAKDNRMVVLAPVFMFTGLLRGFAMGEFTANFIRESLGSSNIGYIMALYGGINVVASYGVGKLADKFGPLLGQMFGYCILIAAYILCFAFPVNKCDSDWALICCISIMLSLGDACLTTLTSAIVGQEFPTNAVNAFSVFKVFQSGAVACSFFFFKYLTYVHSDDVTTCSTGSCSFNSRLAVLVGVAVVACASFVTYAKKYRRVVTDNTQVQA
ncbi:Aste57867_14032 [Aphanomyces stellatus]|uniref:Aste57867_14032 protein n=1 Tax=Aphanomyces stellatus TaxID=120398 RepID=A0A485L0C2_9STRA|nr:hypothetical protein As57867_013981 [Aphanomyces stellatus]VFT90862.1 Aste57867_14032 [Aphanomyces stellatus]